MPSLRLLAASLPHSAPSPTCRFVRSRHQRTPSRVRVSLNHAQRTGVLNRIRKTLPPETGQGLEALPRLLCVNPVRSRTPASHHINTVRVKNQNDF